MHGLLVTLLLLPFFLVGTYVTAECKFARIVKSKVYEQKIRTNCKSKKKNIKRNYMISFLARSF